MSSLLSNMDDSESQKTQLPNTSIDDSPFIKSTRLRKKKTQSKLTYLKQISTKRKKNDTPEISENENVQKNEIEFKGRSSPISVEEQSSSDNMTSGNAYCNKQENSVHACPVCWKRFVNTGDQMQHMKTCAAKHNLTLKQLLDALDLQSKQVAERKSLGLPCVPTTSVKKAISKKSSTAKNSNDPDLQLGLALSVSMSESEEQKLLVEQEIMLEAGLGDEVAANQASLLERFGFTSTRPVLPSIYPSLKPGKAKLKITPPLLVRTQDERERLITEKVAFILTNEAKSLSPLPEVDNEISTISHKVRSEVPFQLQNAECSLWKKSSASPSLTNCDTYYVEPLSHVITPSEINTRSESKYFSQVPCWLKSPFFQGRFSPKVDANLNLNMMTKSRGIFTNNSQNSPEKLKMNESAYSVHIKGDENIFQGEEKTLCEVKTLQGEENILQSKEKIIACVNGNTKIQGKNSEFVSKVIGDWKSLLNNSTMSDLKIYVQDGNEICVHKLVFFVRCPDILQDVKQENDTETIMWGEISFKCALAFLDFIYCGSTGKIDELGGCVDEVLLLSTKYCVEELCCYLKCVAGARENLVLQPCQEMDRISRDFEFESVKPQLHNALVSDSPGLSTDNYHTESSKMVEQNDVKRQDHYIVSNCGDKGDEVIFVPSPDKNGSLHESCTSPDPFVDSCDDEITYVSCNRRNTSPNTQQNMDNLLEALNDNECEEVCHNPSVFSGDNTFMKKSETSGVLKELPEIEIICTEKDNILEASTIKKRKLSDSCNTSSTKQICKNDRHSVRKSLLPSFSDEGEVTLPYVKDELTSNMSRSICKSNSISSGKSVENVSGKSSIHEGGEELNCNQGEIIDEDFKTTVCSPTADTVTLGSSPSPHSMESDVKGRNDMSIDLLGDFCADYEYQKFCANANYSPCSEKASSHSKYDEKKSIKNSPSIKQKYFEVDGAEDKCKSPFSSPLSVKSLSRGDSPLLFHKNKNADKKLYLPRTRSSSDISVNSATSSPILIKCLSQSSIHLKTSHQISKVSDIEDDVWKPSASSQMAVQSPVTPSNVKRTPSKSLNSVKRLLEDSFTAELERNLLERKIGDDREGWPCSTPISTQSRTPVLNKQLQNIKAGDSCITPMADYSCMDTPMLKRELQKYGLKPLKRKRAKQILRHIYNEIHPLVPVQSSEDRLECIRDTQDGVSSCLAKQSEKICAKVKSCKKKSRVQKDDVAASNPLEGAEMLSEHEVSFISTQESSSSSQCEFEIPEDLQEDGALTQIDESELPAIVHNYIMTNPEFHQQVLLYEPIWLEHLQDSLKAQNHKFKLTQLMEYLDEECITFRTAQGSKIKRRKKKEKNSE